MVVVGWGVDDNFFVVVLIVVVLVDFGLVVVVLGFLVSAVVDLAVVNFPETFEVTFTVGPFVLRARSDEVESS